MAEPPVVPPLLFCVIQAKLTVVNSHFISISYCNLVYFLFIKGSLMLSYTEANTTSTKLLLPNLFNYDHNYLFADQTKQSKQAGHNDSGCRNQTCSHF